MLGTEGLRACEPLLGLPAVAELVADGPELDAVGLEALVNLDLAVVGVREVPRAVGLVEGERLVDVAVLACREPCVLPLEAEASLHGEAEADGLVVSAVCVDYVAVVPLPAESEPRVRDVPLFLLFHDLSFRLGSVLVIYDTSITSRVKEEFEMTGIERLREFAKGCMLIGQRAYSNAIGDIADQIERERACDGDTAENIRLIVGGVVDEMERHVLGHEGMEDSPVARWSRELRRALTKNEVEKKKYGFADVSMSAYDLLPPEDREAISWMRGHGGLGDVRRSCQDAENRRVELCSALGIGTGFGWADAMSLLRQRLLPKGHYLLEDHDGEPIVPGDARFGRSDGKRWVIDAVGHDFVWSGLSQTARKRGERPVRLRPEWLTKERPAPKVTAGDGRPLVVGEFVWHKSGVVGGVVESVDAASLMHTVRYRSRRGEEYRDAARDLVHDFPDSWELWVEDSKLHPSKYVDRYRVGRIGYEELDMNRDLVRRAKALAGDA